MDPPPKFPRDTFRELCRTVHGCNYAEGYWEFAAVDEAELVDPPMSSEDWPAKQNFLQGLSAFEQQRAKCLGGDAYRRCSLCSRMTQLGGYRARDKLGRAFTWPRSYSHYIDEHNVFPSQAFFQCIKAGSSANTCICL